jgi:hypothetical protein
MGVAALPNASASPKTPGSTSPSKEATSQSAAAIVYWSVVFLVRFLKKLVEYWFGGGTFSGIPDYIANHFTWHLFAAIQIWIFVLFLIYTSVADLNSRLGKGELVKMFFTRPPPAPQQCGVAPVAKQTRLS